MKDSYVTEKLSFSVKLLLKRSLIYWAAGRASQVAILARLEPAEAEGRAEAAEGAGSREAPGRWDHGLLWDLMFRRFSVGAVASNRLQALRHPQGLSNACSESVADCTDGQMSGPF
ncbi:unnamed protein product [Pleuronectes platessa]|uniref:Uncharacterized protein n=1 Tax=Pleuronectes platessa TaxID=8262 RepID=A0A9N7Z430_PLEPL|nr:unnamed protein product [Pleuronectes platessa]